jgi:hypothetical protein
MYTGMLDRAIRELKGEAFRQSQPSSIWGSTSAFTITSRKKIASAHVQARCRRGERSRAGRCPKELQDRYGEPPVQVRYLLAASALKLLCERVGVLAVDRKRDSVTIKFTEQAAIEPERLARFVAQSKGAQFSPGGVLKFNLKSTQPEAVIDQLNGCTAQPKYWRRRGCRQNKTHDLIRVRHTRRIKRADRTTSSGEFRVCLSDVPTPDVIIRPSMNTLKSSFLLLFSCLSFAQQPAPQLQLVVRGHA